MSMRRDRIGGGRTNIIGGGSRPSTGSGSRPSTPSVAGGNLDGSFERGTRRGESNVRGTSIPLPASIAERISPVKPPSPAPRPQTALSGRSSSTASMRSHRSDLPPRPHTAMAASKPAGEEGGRREVHKSLQWSHPSPHRHSEADDNDGLSSRDTHSRDSTRQSSAASSRRRMPMRPVSAPPSADASAREGAEDSVSAADSRPQTSSSRTSSRRSARGDAVNGGSWLGSQQEVETDRRSDTSSIVEERLVDFQKSFQDKNAAKHALLSECFREVDVNKNGVLGRDELKESMRKFDIEVDDAVIDRLMARCSDTAAMSMQEFKELLWVDQSMDSLFNRGATGAGGRGDNANARHLWAPAKTVNKFIGTINDTLEAERLAQGPPPPRLNLNFSSVRYDILTLGRGGHVDPSVRVPVKHRKTIFDSPYPLGRRTAFDRGDSPYNILSLKSPRLPGETVPTFPNGNHGHNAPVRLHTFARIHRGEYPTQHGHMLTKSTV